MHEPVGPYPHLALEQAALAGLWITCTLEPEELRITSSGTLIVGPGVSGYAVRKLVELYAQTPAMSRHAQARLQRVESR